MESVSLLFDPECQVLGELFTRNGSFAHAILTDEGEKTIGDILASWQTEGVPFHRQLQGVQYQDRISVRDPSFFDAVVQWAKAMRLSLVSVPSDAFECWQLMTQLPLENIQCYSMLLALRALPHEELNEWKKALAEASEAVQIERKKTSARVTHMWRRLARKLLAEVH